MPVLKKGSRELFPGATVNSLTDAAARFFVRRGRINIAGQAVRSIQMKESTTRATILDAVSDIELLARTGAGDTQAFVALMQRHNRRLYRVARAVAGNDVEAEDIVQAGWTHAFAAAGGFRGESQASTWLVRIVLNEAFGRRRKQRPMIEIEKLDDRLEAEVIAFPSNRSNPETDAERAQIRKMLEKAIDDLPPPFRTVFMMRAVEDMTIDEVAAALNLPQATVKTRLHRARARLRWTLEQRVGANLNEAFSFEGARCRRITERVLAALALTTPDGAP
ncbi:RNA polymerase sigma factor [Rhodoblastus sp. 17X3]|uniref:RNA polymerase sigma factor n=1 Tax=Rhodoblastus sp. 17X3 TaxID=3047026 RepID=UPI0024B714BD|nr:RNA polymerase sigma factor [Rhodoblastus sp. 17X3]MDI9846442.1 RNA polymerase sigma factor [Rhodoblastus sp. 17X3]